MFGGFTGEFAGGVRRDMWRTVAKGFAEEAWRK
jgi:hypothetical protein